MILILKKQHWTEIKNLSSRGIAASQETRRDPRSEQSEERMRKPGAGSWTGGSLCRSVHIGTLEGKDERVAGESWWIRY